MPDRDHTPDDQRSSRIGIDEAILCDSKTLDHLIRILADATDKGRPLLLTRLQEEKYTALSQEHRDLLDYDPLSRTGWFLKPTGNSLPAPRVAIVTAGTSDVAVAREVARTLEFSNVGCHEVYDVGVAGVWRLMDRIEELNRFDVVVAAAGMDAALPSVLGGLVRGVIIAVPTSVGYGVATGGTAALNAILASCAPGITVVNIDNGYGAACAALRVLNIGKTTTDQSS